MRPWRWRSRSRTSRYMGKDDPSAIASLQRPRHAGRGRDQQRPSPRRELGLASRRARWHGGCSIRHARASACAVLCRGRAPTGGTPMISSVFSKVRVGAAAAVALTAVSRRPPRPRARLRRALLLVGQPGQPGRGADPVRRQRRRHRHRGHPDPRTRAPPRSSRGCCPWPARPRSASRRTRAFDALKQLTNPTYQLNTVTEGSCQFGEFGGRVGRRIWRGGGRQLGAAGRTPA